MNTTMTIKQIDRLISYKVREVFSDEFMKLRALVLPYISSREQLDIETRYGKKPSRKVVKSLSFEL